jgi:hypothetical protein
MLPTGDASAIVTYSLKQACTSPMNRIITSYPFDKYTMTLFRITVNRKLNASSIF